MGGGEDDDDVATSGFATAEATVVETSGHISLEVELPCKQPTTLKYNCIDGTAG